MPARISPQVCRRAFTTTSRRGTALPSSFHTYNQPQLSPLSASTPKLGKIGRWYLPTMALIAVGMLYTPTNLFSTSSYRPARRTVTLDSANRQIGFAITNALQDYNHAPHARSYTQDQKNNMLMDAFGARDSLEDMQRAVDMQVAEKLADPRERNKRLMDAYGEKTSLRDVRRAMEIYEVQ